MDKPKILYVDDEPVNLMLFEVILEKKYKVITANNGNEGLDIMSKDDEIKVVMSDMKMPVMNGLEFITKAKKILPEIHYYILTGFDITEEIKEAIGKGDVRKYFRKPINMNEISVEIETVIQNLN